MGERLSHRGSMAEEWSVSEILRLGRRRREGGGNADSGSEGTVLLDGFIDNPSSLRLALGEGPAAQMEPDQAGLLARLFHRYGVDAFPRLSGRFSLAVWDTREERLVLARDPWGAVPLYFTVSRGRVLFASEYKALLAIAEVPARPDRNAIQYVQCTRHAAPGACLLMDVHPVPVGSWIAPGIREAPSRRYWDIAVSIVPRAEQEHASAVRAAILESTRRQVARFPRIGVALSGGLDAAIALASLHHVAPERPVHTFTAGFGPEDGEIIRAAEVARHFRTQHHEIFLDPTELHELLPTTIWHMEDPVGREEMPYLYVTVREALRFVDVLLAGHKADALFAGMPRHRLAHLASRFPLLHSTLEDFYHFTQTGEPARTLGGKALVVGYYGKDRIPSPSVRGATQKPERGTFPLKSAQPLSEHLRRGVLDDPGTICAIGQLHSALGLPFNSPYMGTDMARVAFEIPDGLKIHASTQKYILRKAFADLLPASVLERRKSLQKLKHDRALSEVLDALADRHLTPAAVANRGLFEEGYVNRIRRRPAGRGYRSEQTFRLWSLLVTEIWCQLFLDRRGAPLNGLPVPTAR